MRVVKYKKFKQIEDGNAFVTNYSELKASEAYLDVRISTRDFGVVNSFQFIFFQHNAPVSIRIARVDGWTGGDESGMLLETISLNGNLDKAPGYEVRINPGTPGTTLEYLVPSANSVAGRGLAFEERETFCSCGEIIFKRPDPDPYTPGEYHMTLQNLHPTTSFNLNFAIYSSRV